MSFDADGDREFPKLLAGQMPIDLAGLLLDFSADAYPGLDRAACLAELDRLGDQARLRMEALPPEARPLRTRLAHISHLLYDDEGFHGNQESYYDPRNSYLNEILARRTGIPITLGIVYLSVAARAGLPMFGVPAPGHFVLGAEEPGETWYVDPFTQGDVLPLAACRHRVERMTGQEGQLKDAHFRAASPVEIAARVLRNLKAAYVMQDQWRAALPVQQRLVRLLPDLPDEQRDLGLLYLRLGRPVESLELLDPYADRCSPEQLDQLSPYLRSARRMRAELN